MSDPHSDEDRAALKADAITRLRSLEASLDRSDALYRYRESGTSQRESFNEVLRDLQRAGEDIPEASIRAPHPRTMRTETGTAREDWLSGSALRADIKRLLAQVDPR